MSQTLTLEYCGKCQESCQNKFDAKLRSAVGYASAAKQQSDALEHEVFEVKTDLTDVKREHAVDREITKHAISTLDGVLKFSKIIAGIMSAVLAAIAGGYGLIWAFWCSPSGKNIIIAALSVNKTCQTAPASPPVHTVDKSGFDSTQ